MNNREAMIVTRRGMNGRRYRQVYCDPASPYVSRLGRYDEADLQNGMRRRHPDAMYDADLGYDNPSGQ